MSRHFQQKNKELILLDVVSSDKVWDKTKIRNGKPTLRKEFSYYGRIDKGSSAFITKTNSIGENFKFVEDTCKLPKNAKSKIVDMFNNKNSCLLSQKENKIA